MCSRAACVTGSSHLLAGRDQILDRVLDDLAAVLPVPGVGRSSGDRLLGYVAQGGRRSQLGQGVAAVESVAATLQLVQLRFEAVVGFRAVVSMREGGREGDSGAGRVGGLQVGRADGPVDVVLGQVPVLVQPHGQASQLLQAGSAQLQHQERHSGGGIVEQILREAAPTVVELDLRADVVDHLDAGRQAGLGRVLGQDPLREGVQRSHGGAVELLQGRGRRGGIGTRARGGASGLGRAGAGLGLLQIAPDPVAELRRGLLGEGNGGDVSPWPHRHR